MANIYLCVDERDVVWEVINVDYTINSADRILWDVWDKSVIGLWYDRAGDQTLKANPNPPDVVLTKLQFRQRFTLEELQGIYGAESTDVVIKIFLDDLRVADEIVLQDPATQNGVGYLYNNGYITYDRMNEILS